MRGKRWEQTRLREKVECPRQESNLRAWFRRPVLYPLSYGDFKEYHTISVNLQKQAAAR